MSESMSDSDASRAGKALMTTNGTELSEEEFQDNLRLRFGLQPLSLPAQYDG
jgi:hypothetical protein